MGEAGKSNVPEEGEIDPSKEEEIKEMSNTVDEAAAEGFSWPAFRFDIPGRIYHFAHQFRGISNPNNFFKGVKWSPDGSSFLTCSDDNSLRLFYLPEDAYYHTGYLEECQISQDSYASSLILNEAEMVYDYCWYPFMSILDPTTCVFISTTRDHPIHLWDAVSGELRGTYRAYDTMDEISAALSVSFNASGSKVFAGYNKYIRVFDIHRPGRDFDQFSLAKRDAGPSGIVSSIAFPPTSSGMFAIGSYSQTTAVYVEDNMELLYLFTWSNWWGYTGSVFQRWKLYIYRRSEGPIHIVLGCSQYCWRSLQIV
ncbi:hypothetical protein HPP92_018057 [Vanilla planifolia]|uniref:Uncharacterized protein n=1 Tax=Vanilla planifolia TaxID=51239 RepID=A0A835ULX1_VANPL|nr:hypothetical protein HPP92_018057 [Vanilla planifolia]